MDQLDLSAVVTDELAAFLADGVGHDDDGAVAPDRAYERESDTLIAARRLDDDRVVVNQTLLLRLNDHIQRGARLDGAARLPCGSVESAGFDLPLPVRCYKSCRFASLLGVPISQYLSIIPEIADE